MQCPRCEHTVEAENPFVHAARCPACNVRLLPSQTYLSVLAGVSWVIGTGVVFGFLYRSRGLESAFLTSLWAGSPVALVVLGVLMRIVPHFIRPQLVLRYFGPVITLDLGAKKDEKNDLS